MKQFLILLAIFMCVGCTFNDGMSYVDYANEVEARALANDARICQEEQIPVHIENRTINDTLGIYIANGLYITAMRRSFNPLGVTAELEFYSTNTSEEYIDYNLVYTWQPYDTMFVQGNTKTLRIYPHRRTAFTVNLTTGDWLFTLTSIEYMRWAHDCTQNYNPYDDKIHYNMYMKTKYEVMWEGNIQVGKNNDYIRKTCEAGHACSGITNTQLTGSLCADGWVSMSTGSGTCSWHGGLSK